MSGIAENLAMVRDKIARAAEKAGRRGDDVRLIAVTKTRCVAEINEAIRCGVSDIGENYVQESAAKYAEVADGVRWHMIGHLQRNKVSSALRVFDVIQSVDSVELGREISKRASSSGKCVELLIEASVRSARREGLRLHGNGAVHGERKRCAEGFSLIEESLGQVAFRAAIVAFHGYDRRLRDCYRGGLEYGSDRNGHIWPTDQLNEVQSRIRNGRPTSNPGWQRPTGEGC